MTGLPLSSNMPLSDKIHARFRVTLCLLPEAHQLLTIKHCTCTSLLDLKLPAGSLYLNNTYTLRVFKLFKAYTLFYTSMPAFLSSTATSIQYKRVHSHSTLSLLLPSLLLSSQLSFHAPKPNTSRPVYQAFAEALFGGITRR